MFTQIHLSWRSPIYLILHFSISQICYLTLFDQYHFQPHSLSATSSIVKKSFTKRTVVWENIKFLPSIPTCKQEEEMSKAIKQERQCTCKHNTVVNLWPYVGRLLAVDCIAKLCQKLSERRLVKVSYQTLHQTKVNVHMKSGKERGVEMTEWRKKNK